MKRPLLLLLLPAAGLFSSRAAELSRLYDAATLQHSQQSYERTTNKILDQVIWPALLADERYALGNRKPVLELPLYAGGEAREDPTAFYSPWNRPAIVAPVLSLKFLDDLCTAYAWLQIHGYTLETISEYTAILHYGTAPPGGFPPPLAALRIPGNALDNREVDELALGHFVTARTFILLHEMGHIRYRHQGGTGAQSVRQEEQADRFAITVMKRTGLPPLGMLVLFLVNAHWSSFPARRDDTHPLSGTRVRALAAAVDDASLAAKLQKLGEDLDDPEIRAGFVATGKAGDLAGLAPRRPNQLPRTGAAPATAGGPVFNGVYRGELVQFLDPRPTPAEFVFERRGDTVTGRYTFGLGFGTVRDGRVIGNKLYFDWQFGANYGRGSLEALADGSLRGTWGYREARDGAGTLSARSR